MDDFLHRDLDISEKVSECSDSEYFTTEEDEPYEEEPETQDQKTQQARISTPQEETKHGKNRYCNRYLFHSS